MQQVSVLCIANMNFNILTFLAGATSDFTAGNTTQERLDLPARFLQQILLLPYFTMLQRVLLDFDFTFPFTNLF